jgi:N-acetylmuramoyl-L-alanine amidase
MYEIAQKVQTLLGNLGHNILLAEKNSILEVRVAYANEKACDIYVSIHSNAGGGKGCEIWCYPNSVKGMELANKIYPMLSRITVTGDRGVKQSDTYYELKATNMPAIIVEVEFHDNEDGARWIVRNKHVIAAVIASGIHQYLGGAARDIDIPVVVTEPDDDVIPPVEPPSGDEEIHGVLARIAKLVDSIREEIDRFTKGD